MTKTTSEISASELSAFLILCRLGRFFCCPVPYSVQYALNMLLTALLQAALLIPVLYFARPCRIPTPIRWMVSLFALLLAADTAADCFRCLLSADAPSPILTMLLLFGALLYAVSLPRPAVFRAAVFVLFAAAIAFLCLPLGGLFSAQALSVYTPPPTAPDLLLEWKESAELALIPFFAAGNPTAARKAAMSWIGVRCLLLPAVVLFGTMQCGRLHSLHDNPFLLLLARVPLSDALRTDGLWLMLSVACLLIACSGLLSTFCGCRLRAAIPYRLVGIFALCALTILFIIYNPDGCFLGTVALVLTVAQAYRKKEVSA